MTGNGVQNTMIRTAGNGVQNAMMRLTGSGVRNAMIRLTDSGRGGTVSAWMQTFKILLNV